MWYYNDFQFKYLTTLDFFMEGQELQRISKITVV